MWDNYFSSSFRVQMEYLEFSWVDYALFILMFVLSAGIGVYFGCFGKQDTTSEYLQGGKRMKVFPVAMSLVASTLSGVSLLGIPAEVYMHGTQYWMMCISVVFLGIATNYIYLPVFHKIQLTSIFEYLEIRFDKNVRTLTSILYTFANFILMPVFIYAPCLAFVQVTGIQLHTIAPAMCLICIFYTTIGGVKAVVWTDTLQFSVTLCTLGMVLVMGTISVGGLSEIWRKSELGNRIEFFNMDIDPTSRSTFWNVVIGNYFIWTYFAATNQSTMQRYLAVPTYGDSQKVLITFVIFTIVTKSINCFSGLIMYAKYFDCDPFTFGLINKSDQIVPFYVLDVASDLPGLSGLFVAGLFSTALSTLSTCLNALAGVMYQDFVLPFMPKNTTEKTASNIMKLLCFILGVISVGLVFVVEKLGSILQVGLSLNGIVGGALLGVFTLGMVFPFSNKKGALYGSITSLLVMGTIAIRNQFLIWNGVIKAVPKVLHTHGCNVTLTTISTMSSLTYTTLNNSAQIISEASSSEQEEPFWLFRISFYYYVCMGTLITVILGLIISWFTNESEEFHNPDLFAPFVHRFLRLSEKDGQYGSVHKNSVIIRLQDIECETPALEKLMNEKN